MTESIVWITGASSGIGAALAATVPFDARVVDVSRSGGTPGSEHLPADLTEPSAWAVVEERMVGELADFAGDRAVFVHNAGTIEPIGFAGEVDSAAYRHSVLLNSAAAQALGHAFLKAVRAFDGQKWLIMLTSGAASSPYEGWSGYCAGKASVDMWVRSVGREQARRGGCRVLAVAPGVVDTAMQAKIRTVSEADFPAVGKFLDLHARGALTDPSDAAKAIWGLLDRNLDNGAVVDLRKL